MKLREALTKAVNAAIARGAPVYTNVSRGQRDYEADVAKFPTYHNGKPRPPFADLPAWAKESWERA
jgi:hypothetical protein